MIAGDACDWHAIARKRCHINPTTSLPGRRWSRCWRCAARIIPSCNVAFDWQFINYYFHRFLGRNPFGFSGRRIGDLYAGLVKDASKASEWKKYRVTKHTHNPVDDARGNAEALRKFRELGLKI